MKLPLPFAAAPRRPRLLVVDDQPINVQTLYQALSAEHQVFVATGGEQALKLAREKQPDLVLLDVVMPDIDGYEVCRRLKADSTTADIPVIFVTAHSDEHEEAQGLDAGAVDFIAKPINPRIVRARVKTHLTLKQQSDQLRQMAFVDGLTGVFNRRYFDERLQQEWLRAMRNGTPLTLMLIDIDAFKPFNDRYGHQAGDDCLRRVAHALAAGLQRPADLLARYGGEEFACVLPETEVQGALALAQRLSEQVKALAIEHADAPSDRRISVSIGVAGRPASRPGEECGGSIAELLVRTDRQLYRAKNAGRARVCAE
ncbi:diguanylate cyclase [Aquabacterium sp.]|uniref:diguanylate cyclase n=1 Tax=Aquabacterium sp. TaxID=1872578 RepID=UPI002C1AB7F3|nr:diguanylate cyclase [Aquabacterium sp.]HSW05973.1 diguanylate cyclase [Aquabacterium sp.]